MKRISTLLVFVFCCVAMNAQFDYPSYINGLKIEKDIMYEGAHGIRISYEYDFSKLNALLKEDSIIKKSEFKIVISLLKDNLAIKSTQNFNLLSISKEDISSKKLLSSDLLLNPKGKESQFIPYAALLIPVGQNEIACSILLDGHDGKGDNYTQKIKQDNVSITKKEQYLMTVNLESLVADTFDFHHQYWDGGLFCDRCVTPDINVFLKLGKVTVWDDWSKDSYRYFGDEKSKNISFYISKGDQVELVVMDNDIMFHDYMGSVGITPKESQKHNYISCQNSFGRINQCSMQWKID